MERPRILDDPAALEPLRGDPRGSALLFDLDGTLSPLVDDPRQAPFPPETRALVEGLARRYALVSIVSGRSADALRSIVGLEGVVYVGNHGLEILGDGGREVLVPPDLVQRLAAIARELAPSLEGRPGIFFEEKELSLAIHYRRAPDREAARRFILETLASVDLGGFRIRGGKMLLQIRPDIGVDKGAAVMMLLRRAGLAKALYAGDDQTDLDVFRTFRRAGGAGRHLISVGVVDSEADPEVVGACDYVVEGIAGMRRVLGWLLA